MKEYRQKNQESQFEFAANIGICVEELSKLERKIANPSLETLQKIAAYTGNEVWKIVYIKKDKRDEPMHQVFLDQYWKSQRHKLLEENEIYREIRNHLERMMQTEEFMEYEEKLHDFVVQITQESFLAGCEAILQCRCAFCTKVMDGIEKG